MKRIEIMIVATGLAGYLSGSPADEMGSTQTVRVNNYALTMPAGWERIPDRILDIAQSRMAEMAPQSDPTEYVTGFQKSGTDRWMTYPYVLVQEIREW